MCCFVSFGFYVLDLLLEIPVLLGILRLSLATRTARVIGGLDSSDIFCNSDYKHFLA
jgi:hypothetical protein